MSPDSGTDAGAEKLKAIYALWVLLTNRAGWHTYVVHGSLVSVRT